jgi:hypothetical protein
VSDVLRPWEEVRARVRALPARARAVFALAAAERLLSCCRPGDDALGSALAVGWRVALSGGGPWQAVRDELEQRPDLDDDEVAAVFFALGAAAGSAEDAEWTARRCADAAYGRVPYPEGATEFRPLGVDTSDAVVQEELLWQETALDLIEESGAAPEVIDRLRT